MAPVTAGRSRWRRLRKWRPWAHARQLRDPTIEHDDEQQPESSATAEEEEEHEGALDGGPGFVGLYRTESHSEDRIEDEIFGENHPADALTTKASDF